MSPEGKGFNHPIFEKIDREIPNISTDKDKSELKGTPESRAEEVFALWQDYRRIRIHLKNEGSKNPDQAQNKTKLSRIKGALSERWSDPATRQTFKKNIEEAG